MSTTLEFAYYDQLHREKYRDKNQTKIEHSRNLAKNLSSSEDHENALRDIFLHDRFLCAGRVQAAMGATEREVSAFNCSVSQTIEDSMDSIMDALGNAARILRLGTGIGYNFSNLRPKGALVKKLQTQSSGPLSFMWLFDAMAGTIASSGHRRGAQMGVMNISHPDIESFIDAKLEKGAYRQFNLSVGVTDAFMDCLREDGIWSLTFDDVVYKTVRAKDLWDKMMWNAYNSAEPGVIYLDRINKYNNLYYCENIEATNPCAEQPLPANGLCLLGSFNLTQYLVEYGHYKLMFDYATFIKDIKHIVRAYDNIFDRSVYAIDAHRKEAQAKRRMGLGLTGISSAIERLVGHPSYGEEKFNEIFSTIANTLMCAAYEASIELAKERGSFELFDKDKYLASSFVSALPTYLKTGINQYGIRNSHLISYAPCGTISQTVGNISSGVEPIFYHAVSRDVFLSTGLENVTLSDYNVREHDFYGKTLNQVSVDEHIKVAAIAQRYCDSAVSKTINVASSCTYEEYEHIYRHAYEHGSKGITVFRPTELRGVVISEAKKEPVKQYKYGESGSCVGDSCSM